PYEEDYAYHVYHQYVIKLDNEHWRDPLHEFLLSKGVQNAIYYPEPIHLSKAYRFLGYSQGNFPMAEYISQKVLALPMHPFLTEEEQKYVVDCIKEFFADGG
ncbi:MAG: transcriptional regulator, partial [Chlorobi bacterium]|nr:transcriptional regulator [Chlorobiota bacterium]